MKNENLPFSQRAVHNNQDELIYVIRWIYICDIFMDITNGLR